MEDEPFLFPVVVSRGQEVIAEACNKAIATTLVAWEPLRGVDGPVSVAMGCKDGSVYIFQSNSKNSSPTEALTRETSMSSKAQRPTSSRTTTAGFPNISRLQRPPSPTASNTSSSAHFKASGSSKHASFQPSKSRVQSGVSKEQVEAPKSHVDYGEEPAKLKLLLKPRDTKERGLIESLMPSLNLGHHHHQRAHSSETHSQQIERNSTYSQVSTAQVSSTSASPPLSPTGTSAMRSPQMNIDTSSDGLKLAIHTFPPQFGQGRAATALEYMEDGALLASLQECGTLSIYSTTDGRCMSSIQISSLSATNPPMSITSVQGGLKTVWRWCKLSSGVFGETAFLSVVAGESTSTWDTPPPRTRVTIIHVKSASERKFATPPEFLTKIGEWIVESPFQSVGTVVDASGNPIFYHLTSSKHLVFFRISILDRVKLNLPNASSTPASENIINLPMTTIPIPNPFKIRRPRVTQPVSVYDIRPAEESLVELENISDLDDLGFEETEDFEVMVHKMAKGEILVTYSATVLKVFSFLDAKLNFITSLNIPDIQSVEFIPSNVLIVQTDSSILGYRISHTGDTSPENILKIPPSSPGMVITTTSNSLLSISLNTRGSRKMNAWRVEAATPKRKRLWRNRLPDIISVRITTILSLELDSVIVGFDDGYLRRTTFKELLGEIDAPTPVGEPSDQALEGSIVCLQLCRNERSGEYYLVGGTDGGVVAVWTLQSLQLLARWTIFATPLISVIKLADDAVGRLKGSVLCVASGGTLAVLMLDGLEVSFIIPGGPGRLEKICLGEDNLMLVYTNDMARLWDVKTQEFWRSMTRDKAEELLEQGGWFETAAEPEGPIFSSSLMGCAERSFASSDSSATIVLDIRHLASQARLTSGAPMPGEQTATSTKVISAAASKQLDLLRPLVASLLTFGLDESIDTSIREAFGVSAAPNFCGICSFGGTSSLVNHRTPSAVWSVSSEYTSWRLLAICSVLRASLGSQEMDHDVNTTLIYYAASLSEAVGKQYRPPSLDILARYWFDSSTEIRTSARALFDAAVGQLSDDEVLTLATDYQHRLPCLQPDIHKEAPWAVVALIIVGNLAIARHASFSPGTIMDVAASIALYLHDENSTHRVVAIDLSSRGLQIWQGYTDTMEILRSLFDLATSPRKDADGSPIRNARAQARLAVLQISSSNTHLFMTKLLLDIVQPRTPEHSRAIMQLLAFLIRKKPLVLYPSLSRLMEAVVKSMDPNSSFRDMVIDAATEILGEVVKLYPTVDFHAGSQKLVVGTHEGAAVLYDLKTATRLYVLEGHKKRLAACSFSPDGRRLVTLSLEESVVMVWKVGSSFTSFFYPGAPPRQGNSGSEPFKTLSFNVGSEAYMTTAATLEWVGFDWPTDRTARLRIRDSVLTFNT